MRISGQVFFFLLSVSLEKNKNKLGCTCTVSALFTILYRKNQRNFFLWKPFYDNISSDVATCDVWKPCHCGSLASESANTALLLCSTVDYLILLPPAGLRGPRPAPIGDLVRQASFRVRVKGYIILCVCVPVTYIHHTRAKHTLCYTWAISPRGAGI